MECLFSHTHLFKNIVLFTYLLALLVKAFELEILGVVQIQIYPQRPNILHVMLQGERSQDFIILKSSPGDLGTGGLHTGIWDPVVEEEGVMCLFHFSIIYGTI